MSSICVPVLLCIFYCMVWVDCILNVWFLISALTHVGYDESGTEELRVEISGSNHPSPAPSPGDDRVHAFAIERTEALR